MPQHAASPDLVELTRLSMEATNRRPHDASWFERSCFAADAVFDVSSAGLGRFEGAEAIRRYLEEWMDAYAEQRYSGWEGSDLGNGVVLVVTTLDARLLGSSANVRERWAFVVRWSGEALVEVIADRDVAQARALAERLARAAGG
jgi:hypothetical protein